MVTVSRCSVYSCCIRYTVKPSPFEALSSSSPPPGTGAFGCSFTSLHGTSHFLSPKYVPPWPLQVASPDALQWSLENFPRIPPLVPPSQQNAV